MLKVMLLIDCDGCRRLFLCSRFASEDTSAWRVHGDILSKMAEDVGWIQSSDGNLHFCSACLKMDDALYFA